VSIRYAAANTDWLNMWALPFVMRTTSATSVPEGDPERKTKKAEARRVRELELQKLRRRKKSKSKPSSSATGETS
jgi:hypothetical protein